MTTASASDLHLHAPALEPAFEALYEEHFDYVWTNLRRLGVHGPDLDDAVQETFLVVYRRLEDFDRGASWKSWLFGIARRIASRHRRGLGRQLRRLAALGAAPPQLGDTEAELTRIEAARLLQGFLDRLEPKKREVFILAEMEGFSAAEIADVLGVPANTVGSRLRAARGAFDRWVETLRARERGVAARIDRGAIVRRSREARPPARSRDRVRTALAARMALPIGAVPWWVTLKPLALATGIGVVGVSAAIGVVGRDPTPTIEVSRSAEPEIAHANAPRGHETRAAEDPALHDASESPVQAIATPEAAPIGARPEADARSDIAARTGPGDGGPARASARAPRIQDASPTEVGSASTLAAEAALVARIRAAAHGTDPASALALADEHARTHPGGTLERERRALVIAALCRLGRTDQAASQARAWARSHPDAPLPADVRDGCADAEKKVDGQDG
jgi:RNA polymerase sigma-70 factor (ECF subfamily)